MFFVVFVTLLWRVDDDDDLNYNLDLSEEEELRKPLLALFASWDLIADRRPSQKAKKAASSMM